VARAMSLEPEARFSSVLALGRALLPFASPHARAVWATEFAELSAPSSRQPAVVLRPADLGALPLWSGVPEAELAELLTLAPPARVEAGAAVFDQGARAASAFVVVSGEVEIFKTHGADTWEIDGVGAGALLGLIALWDDTARSVSAIAKIDCVVVELKRAALPVLAERCPAVVDRLHDEATAAAVRRLRGAGERASQLFSRPKGPSREALVRLAAAIGEWSIALPADARGRG